MAVWLLVQRCVAMAEEPSAIPANVDSTSEMRGDGMASAPPREGV